MDIPLGPSLTAFMKFLGLDWKRIGENLHRVKPSLKLANQKSKWKRWQGGKAYPQRSSLYLIFAGLGFYRFEDFKRSWEKFKAMPEGREALRIEEKELAKLVLAPQISVIAEAVRPFDADWKESRPRIVKDLVEQRFEARRKEISAGMAQAADSLWPQLLRNAEIVDDQIEIFDAICGKREP